jgi:L-amino acid N-acyltransferase YncA
MPEPITLLPMTAADLGGLWETFSEAIEDGTSYVQDETTTREDFAEYWSGRGGEQWIASGDGRVLGAYTLRPNHVGRGAHVATASYVVARTTRGQGLGARLGRHSVERAKALGFRAIQFNLVVSTNEPAVTLWKALGFSIVGTLPGAFRDRERGYVDAYVMYRTLAKHEA